VNIKQIVANTLELAQPYLIERVTSILGIESGKINEKLTPVGKPLLNKDLQGVPRKYDWEYCRAIGMLTYLLGAFDQTLQWLLISVQDLVLVQ
jgi:hypothetical protein